MASTQGGRIGAIFGDDDYLSLEKLSVSLEKESVNDDGAFTLCFWVYLLKTSKTGVLIRQVAFTSMFAKRLSNSHLCQFELWYCLLYPFLYFQRLIASV